MEEGKMNSGDDCRDTVEMRIGIDEGYWRGRHDLVFRELPFVLVIIGACFSVASTIGLFGLEVDAVVQPASLLCIALGVILRMCGRWE